MGTADRIVKVLLDTAVAIWLDANPRRISVAARQLIEDDHVTCYVSVISIWELEVKALLKKLPLKVSVREAIDTLVDNYHVELLDLGREACHQQMRLPFHHRDPFDRLIMCQGIAESLPIVSPDPIFNQYPVRVIW